MLKSSVNNHIAIIMAGGQSNRMGINKALLKRGDKPLLEYVTQQIQATGIESIYINSNVSLETQLPIFIDALPSFGPLSAIHSTFKALFTEHQNSHCLFVPVDMPLVSPTVLNELIDGLTSDVQVCHFKSHPLPCALKLEPLVLQQVERILFHSDNYAVKHLFHHLSVNVLPVTNEHALTNTNTPQQWQQVIDNISG